MILYQFLLTLFFLVEVSAQIDFPSVYRTFPSNRAIEVDPTQINDYGISFTFEEPIDFELINLLQVRINNDHLLDWSASILDDSTLVFTPADSSSWAFESDASYILHLKSVRSIDGEDGIKFDLVFTTAQTAIIRTINESPQSLTDQRVRRRERASALDPVYIDATGVVFFSDRERRRLLQISSDGTLTNFAGTGDWGFSGDGGPATLAKFSYIRSPLVDAANNVFVVDEHRIRKIYPDGMITTIAGTGEPGYSGDDGPAIYAMLNNPTGLFIDAAGNLLVGDCDNDRIRKITPEGIISTIASSFRCPSFIHVDQQGNLYFVESQDVEKDFYSSAYKNLLINKISIDRSITRIMSNGGVGFSGDGGPAIEARAGEINDIKVDASGAVFFIDGADRIRKIFPNGIVTTIAGVGQRGYSGDGGPAVLAQLNDIEGLSIDATGNVLFADDHRVRMIDGAAAPTPANTGIFPYDPAPFLRWSFPVDGDKFVSPETVNQRGIQLLYSETLKNTNQQLVTFKNGNGRTLDWTVSVVGDTVLVLSPSDPSQNIQSNTTYQVDVTPIKDIKDNESTPYTIRFSTLEQKGIIRTIAGTGDEGSGRGEGIQATRVALKNPRDISGDKEGNLYFSESYRIRKISSDGLIETLREVGPPSTVLAVDSKGDIYYHEASYDDLYGRDFSIAISTLDKISSDGHHSRFGNLDGHRSSIGNFLKRWPESIFIDKEGNAICTSSSHIFKLSTNGSLSIVAGLHEGGFNGDNQRAVGAQLSRPQDVFVDPEGNLLISDTGNFRIRKITPSFSGYRYGTITTIAGTGIQGVSGDGGLAIEARLSRPRDLFIDVEGNLFFIDGNRVRKISTDGIISTVAGRVRAGFSGDGGLATQAQLNEPSGLFIDAQGNLLIADSSNHRIRMVEGIAAATVAPSSIGSSTTDSLSSSDSNQLYQNFPNPFYTSTTITYHLDHPEPVHLGIFSISGQKIRTLVNSTQRAGFYEVHWNGTNDLEHLVSAGAYLIRLKAGNWTKTHKALFIK